MTTAIPSAESELRRLSLAIRNRLLTHCEHLVAGLRHQADKGVVVRGMDAAIEIVRKVRATKYPLAYLAALKLAVERDMERVKDDPQGEQLREGMYLVVYEIEKEAAKIDKV